MSTHFGRQPMGDTEKTFGDLAVEAHGLANLIAAVSR
jgi:hypothetical protein